MTLEQPAATDLEVATELQDFGHRLSEAAAGSQVKPEGIAILGSHPATKMAAPFDKNWLIYACSPDNSPYGFGERSELPRVTEWFEVHNPIFDQTRPYAYLDWLRVHPKVWMRDPVAIRMKAENGSPLFPNAVLYPEDEVKSTFNPYAFTSSIAFMMAKAILDCERQRIPQLGLWGILQASEHEYVYQRAGTQYFIWEAVRRGIKVHVARESRLFEPPPENF